MIYHNTIDMIGNTPLLQLHSENWSLKNTDIYMKLEYLNPFGSIKDRTALGMLNGVSTKNKRLIESSSGNTGKALQLFASQAGTSLTVVTDRVKVPEVHKMLQYLGAEIISLPGHSECPDPNDEGNTVNTIYRMMRDNPDTYIHTSQYDNKANTQIHADTTAAECYHDLADIDAVVIGIGTAGSSGGFISYARDHHMPTKMIGVVTDTSDFLPGIRTKTELFGTNLFHKSDYSTIVSITSHDALQALLTLVWREGVLAGPTTGANLAAAVEYARQHDELIDGRRQCIVVVACDRLENYFSYIEKRQPELFKLERNVDVYEPHDFDARYEKPATEQTRSWMRREHVLVVDTRGTKPFGMMHIDGAINYPEEILRELLAYGRPLAEQTVLLVCPVGDRSAMLTMTLRNRGIAAYSLKGGLTAWRNASLPLVRQKHAA